MSGLHRDTDEYYSSALDPIFKAMNIPAYVTVARWSYTPGAINPLLFNPKPVGGMEDEQAVCIQQECNRDAFKSALREFSFTQLLVQNDREIWFHFTNEKLEKGDEQAFLNYVHVGLKRIQVLRVAAERVTDQLVVQIINAFEKGAKEGEETFYGRERLLDKKEQMKVTLNAAIFSLFQTPGCKVKNIYFMPVVMATGSRRVVGIISINSSDELKISQLASVLGPSAQGIMSEFHFEEIDEQRKMFSLRSAIAAIMSRNMSHNIGSHVLWHLSQEL